MRRRNKKCIRFVNHAAVLSSTTKNNRKTRRSCEGIWGEDKYGANKNY